MSLWFKNFQFYRFVESISFDENTLAEALDEQRFTPCSSQAQQSFGWVSPLHRNANELVYAANGCLLFCMRSEQKVIPPSLLKETLEERVVEIEQAQGRSVFRKERQQLKEDILSLLLPKALTRANHTLGYIDTRNGFMVVNASSPATADAFIELLIESVKVLGAAKLTSEQNPSAVFNRWLTEALPEGWQYTGDYELKDPVDQRVARFKDNEAENPVLDALLADGYWVSKLGVNFQDRLKCALQDDLQIKSVKFSDELLKENESINTEDDMAKWDADFVLMSRTIADFVSELEQVLA